MTATQHFAFQYAYKPAPARYRVVGPNVMGTARFDWPTALANVQAFNANFGPHYRLEQVPA